ncbi:hypothetical protein ACOI91_13145 [Corynebacterium striatum]|uniref:hypothetical protein n=1 Tax=Corynebacterium striatum TaxID=43770 RepID=UPI003B5A1A6D
MSVHPCCPESSGFCGMWDEDGEVFADVGGEFCEALLYVLEVVELGVIAWA